MEAAGRAERYFDLIKCPAGVDPGETYEVLHSAAVVSLDVWPDVLGKKDLELRIGLRRGRAHGNHE